MIQERIDPALRSALRKGEYSVDERAVAEAILRRPLLARALASMLPAGKGVDVDSFGEQGNPGTGHDLA